VVYQTLISGPNANKNAPADDKYAAKWRIDRHCPDPKACLGGNISRLKSYLRSAKEVNRRLKRGNNAIAITFYYASHAAFSDLIAKERQILPLRSAYYS
jgi:hypothetical protein